MGMGGQRQAPAVLPSGKPRCPLYRGLCGPKCFSGWVRTVCLVLTGKEMDFYSKGLAKRPLSYFVQNNRSENKVPRRKILSASYVKFPYQNKLIKLLYFQSANCTANLIGCSVQQEVRSLTKYRTFQSVSSFNCSLFRFFPVFFRWNSSREGSRSIDQLAY
jgi:hypothetical protein